VFHSENLTFESVHLTKHSFFFYQNHTAKDAQLLRSLKAAFSVSEENVASQEFAAAFLEFLKPIVLGLALFLAKEAQQQQHHRQPQHKKEQKRLE
jgi:hypothetical protein